MMNDNNHGNKRRIIIQINTDLSERKEWISFYLVKWIVETLKIIQLNDYNVSIKSEIYMTFFVKNRNMTIMDMQEII